MPDGGVKISAIYDVKEKAQYFPRLRENEVPRGADLSAINDALASLNTVSENAGFYPPMDGGVVNHVLSLC